MIENINSHLSKKAIEFDIVTKDDDVALFYTKSIKAHDFEVAIQVNEKNNRLRVGYIAADVISNENQFEALKTLNNFNNKLHNLKFALTDEGKFSVYNELVFVEEVTDEKLKFLLNYPKQFLSNYYERFLKKATTYKPGGEV